MSRTHFHATTALGLCLALVPLTASAQSFGAGTNGAAMFVPSVQACVEAPNAETCQPVRAVVIECAEDLGFDRCASLFADASAVFDDPAQHEQAQRMLSQTSDALEQSGFAEADGEATASTDDSAQRTLTQEERQEARREERREERRTERRAESTDEEPEQEPFTEAEQAPSDQATTQEERQEARREDRREERRAERRPESTDEESDQEPFTEAEQAPSDQATTQEERQEARREERREDRREERREEMRAEAEAMAEEEPELITEAAPEVEFVAPDEAPRDLDAEQQGALDRLMQDPEVTAAVSVLGGMFGGARSDEPQDQSGTGIAAAATAFERSRSDGAGRDEAGDAADVSEEAFTADELRTSRDDFESGFDLDFDAGQARRDNRRDLERAGLVALGALAVGMIVNRNRVVARSDERVVVLGDDGEYAVWRDDDVILRQEGSQRRIERYEDGSSLSRWDQPDGSQIVTIRDATGRLLLRERILPDGTTIRLVDDMRVVEPVDFSTLPPPRRRELRITQRTDPELALSLLREAEADARQLDRAYTLRQVREVRELRELVPVLSPDPITFETNRANVRPEEARKLAQVGRLMEQLIAANPRELFLVEGHTDATGPAAYNLALSDRRAESVALALTEFFVIPPENLIIQGYGERYLRIPTASAEERNRRVAIRRISPLLGL